MTDFIDAFTVKGPLEAFLQPSSRVTSQRDKEICEGTVVIEWVDVATNTLYFSPPIPQGIKRGKT